MKNSDITAWPPLDQPFFSLSNSLWALIPLEAWRRGLTVTLRPGARYTISDGQSTRAFVQTRLSGSAHDAVARASDDKHATRELLLAAGLPAPQGRGFHGQIDTDEVLSYADSLGYPVCLKPNAWAKGRGVFPRLEDRTELAKALNELVADMGCDDLVLEQHIRGEALRVSVASRRVIAVTLAEPANIVGDGVSAVSELVDQKNAVRSQNPHLKNHRLALDDTSLGLMEKQGLSPSSVLPDGEILYLRETANLAQGGDSWDLTDSLPQEIADIAIAAVEATHGLAHAGVDLLVEDPSRGDSRVFINELNPSAGMGGHLYPGKGNPRDVPSAIVDQYFPGTERIPHSDRWVFALDPITRLLVSRTASEVQVPPLPQLSQPMWNILRVDADDKRIAALRQKVLGRLTRLDIHGQLDRPTDGHFDVKIAGERKHVDQAVRAVHREAEAVAGRVRLASRAAFPTAVGFRQL